MVLSIIDKAAVGDAGLPPEGLMIPVGCCRKDGSLTDLSIHQNLHSEDTDLVIQLQAKTCRHCVLSIMLPMAVP